MARLDGAVPVAEVVFSMFTQLLARILYIGLLSCSGGWLTVMNVLTFGHYVPCNNS